MLNRAKDFVDVPTWAWAIGALLWWALWAEMGTIWRLRQAGTRAMVLPPHLLWSWEPGDQNLSCTHRQPRTWFTRDLANTSPPCVWHFRQSNSQCWKSPSRLKQWAAWGVMTGKSKSIGTSGHNLSQTLIRLRLTKQITFLFFFQSLLFFWSYTIFKLHNLKR